MEGQNQPTVQPGQNKNTAMAVLAYILFFVPLLTDSKKDSFVMYHVKQSIAIVVMVIAANILGVIPFLGRLISLTGSIFSAVCFVMGVLNAINGQEKPLPLIGRYAEKINFGK